MKVRLFPNHTGNLSQIPFGLKKDRIELDILKKERAYAAHTFLLITYLPLEQLHETGEAIVCFIVCPLFGGGAIEVLPPEIGKVAAGNIHPLENCTVARGAALPGQTSLSFVKITGPNTHPICIDSHW